MVMRFCGDITGSDVNPGLSYAVLRIHNIKLWILVAVLGKWPKMPPLKS